MRPLLLVVAAMLVGCTKDEPKAAKDEPKKASPAPSDMVFNDFLPQSGGATGLAVKLDGGGEGGLAAIGDGGAGAPSPGAEAAQNPDEKLKVIDPGAEPRTARKYAFVANRVDKRLLTAAQQQIRGGQVAQELTMTMSMELVPKQVKPTGSRFAAKITKVDLPGAAAGAQQAQLTQALAGMGGLTGSFDVTPRGEVGEVSFEGDNQKMQNPLAESVVQALQQGIELVLPPFPDQPIGVGAKWERSVDKKEGGLEQTAKHAFTLKEVSDTGGVIEADIELKVPKRALPPQRGVPPGATVAVDGKGHYTYQFRFDRVATKVTGELTINQHLEAADQTGKKQSMDETQKAKHTIETPPGK